MARDARRQQGDADAGEQHGIQPRYMPSQLTDDSS